MHALHNALALAATFAVARAPTPLWTGDGLGSAGVRGVRRCDMRSQVFLGPHGAPGYTEGEWVLPTEERRSITEYLPMECFESTTQCPVGGCHPEIPVPIGKSTGPWDLATSPSFVCSSFYEKCYKTRSSETFRKNLRGMTYVWRPSNDCFFSPVTVVSPTKWRGWAAGIAASAGATLFVGDELLSELFTAYQYFTTANGATGAEFQLSRSLTNTYTLAPMRAEDVDACLTPTSGGDLPALANTITPCPPAAKSEIWWEDNSHHTIDSMRWTKVFERRMANTGGVQPYSTLVLGTGSHLWKQHTYSASIDSCNTAGGAADAYKPLQSLGPGLKYGCDVFSVRYPILVQNIARYLGNSPFTGHVIFVTTPPAVAGCDGASQPHAKPAPSQATLTKDSGAAYYWGQVRYSEGVWYAAFQKWAPRLKLSVLNITHLSATRADTRPPADCEHFCFPGLPHVWAEMLLRVLEQHHYHI